MSMEVLTSMDSTQTQTHKQSSNSRNELEKRYAPRNPRPWQKSYIWARDLVSPSVYMTLLILAELCGDLYPPEIALRVIASRRDLEVRTIQNHLKALEKAKIIRIERRKISWCRNTPNRYILLDINGEPLYLIHARNCREKLNTESNTTTAPQERRVDSGNRTFQDDHPPAMRSLYELNGRLMRSRHHRAAETRQYFAWRANVGVYTPDQTAVNAPRSDQEHEKWAETLRKRNQERQAAAEAQIAAANEQRKREQAERERRRQAEAAEPISAEEQATIDRLNRRLNASPATPRQHEIVFPADYRERQNERLQRAEAIAREAAAAEVRERPTAAAEPDREEKAKTFNQWLKFMLYGLNRRE